MVNEPMTRAYCLRQAAYWQKGAALSYRRLEEAQQYRNAPGAVSDRMSDQRMRAGTARDYMEMADLFVKGDRAEHAETALRAIAAQDDVELALDPQWAKRIAQAALDEVTSTTSTSAI